MSGIIGDNTGRGTGLIKAAGGGGKVGQYLYTVLTAHDQSSSTTDSWIDVTNLNVAITPSATNSIIIIDYSLITSNGDRSYWGWSKVSRDIGGAGYGDWNYNIGASDGSSARCSGAVRQEQWGGSGSDKATSDTGAKLKDDTHNTTSEITYKVQFYNANGGAVKINRSNNTTDSDETARSISWISATEILA